MRTLSLNILARSSLLKSLLVATAFLLPLHANAGSIASTGGGSVELLGAAVIALGFIFRRAD
jgi:hypothetical protein